MLEALSKGGDAIAQNSVLGHFIQESQEER